MRRERERVGRRVEMAGSAMGKGKSRLHDP